MQYNAIPYITVLHGTIQFTSFQFNTVRTIQSVLHSTMQYITIQYNTIQYNTIQYNTIQYKNSKQLREITESPPTRLTWLRKADPKQIQYNTIQYNTQFPSNSQKFQKAPKPPRAFPEAIQK